MTAGCRYRWSDRFTWIGGIFRGPVPSYGVADLTAGYKVRRRMQILINVTNVFDNKHYEVFGGDILRRTALLTVSHNW
jgi:outer membrane receptor protein involved in Fe transport